jgi:hypothetical protein
MLLLATLEFPHPSRHHTPQKQQHDLLLPCQALLLLLLLMSHCPQGCC